MTAATSRDKAAAREKKATHYIRPNIAGVLGECVDDVATANELYRQAHRELRIVVRRGEGSDIFRKGKPEPSNEELQRGYAEAESHIGKVS